MNTNINLVWCNLLIDALYRHGVRCFCLSSGARSGPLAMAVARHPEITPVLHFDERASAFYALGYARATGLPAAWITTSGTAVANGLPAMVEASQDGVPLIALTADRPPELRDNGSNQTILQSNIFGVYSRWSVDMPCPDTAIPAAYVLTTAAQAYARAIGADAGPVHLNLMLRDPLGGETDGVDYSAYLAAAPHAPAVYTQYLKTVRAPSEQDPSDWKERLRRAAHGLLLIGRLRNDAERRAASRIASHLPWPMMADIGSGLRLGAGTGHRITFADQLLLHPSTVSAPDFILHLGGPMVSKRIPEWSATTDAFQMVVQSQPRRQDPLHTVRCVVEADLSEFAATLQTVPAQPSQSLEQWKCADQTAGGVIRDYVAADAELDEIFVAATIARLLPPNTGLFMGSSMPIRDMDRYALPEGAPVPVAANRGASGIDGTLATACGWAQGHQRPVVAVVGDLAFLHDLNALHYLQSSSSPVVVVVINNNGGGIFSFLPVARQTDVFEAMFGTPHGMTFEHAAAQFSLPYHQPTDRAAFTATFTQTLAAPQAAVIEVRTDRTTNLMRHQQLQARVVAALAALS